MTLFDPGPTVTDDSIPERKPTGRTDYTAIAANLFARGLHPATRGPLLVCTGETCRDCAHSHRYHYHNKHFVKCDAHRLGESHSEASDIRLKWPACARFVERLAD